MLLKIGFTIITQNWFHKPYSKLIHMCYSKLVSEKLLKIDPQVLLKIDSETLLKIDSQVSLKIGYTSGTQNWLHKQYSKLVTQAVLN